MSDSPGTGAREQALERVADAALAVRLWSYLRPYWPLVLASIVMLPMASALTLLQPHLIQVAVDEHLVPGVLPGLDLLVALYAGTLVLEYCLLFGQFALMQLAGQRALHDMRRQMFEHVQGLALRYFHRTPVGRLMARLTTDTDALQEALASGVVSIIGDVLTLAAIVVVLLIKSTKLALATFAVVPVLVGFTFLFRFLMREAFRVLRVKIAALNSYLNEAVTGMAVLQLFQRERQAFDEYDAINREHRDAAFDSIRWDAALYALVETLSNVTVATIIWFGAGQTAQQAISLGVLIAFVEYVQRFFVPIRELSQKYAVIQSAMASSERIFQVLDTEDFVPDPPSPRTEVPLGEGIRFEGVSFSYDGRTPVLDEVSLHVRPGERVALVGHTGAGKSTLVNLLLRFYDVDSGAVTIGGVDVREMDARSLRRRFAVVLQDGFLFAGTVRDNITLGSEDVSPAQVLAAVEAVGLGRMLAARPRGLDTVVEERGLNLSGGERQLVCFARALAHRPEIMVLDEATANVDAETESVLQAAVEALLSRQTSVVVAHRLSTIRTCDRIVVMHHGRVAEQGTHDELMARGGLYATLVRLQYAEMRR